MKNQYEIDYQQSHDAANQVWLDSVKGVRRELDELQSYGAKLTDGYRRLNDREKSILNLRLN